MGLVGSIGLRGMRWDGADHTCCGVRRKGHQHAIIMQSSCNHHAVRYREQQIAVQLLANSDAHTHTCACMVHICMHGAYMHAHGAYMHAYRDQVAGQPVRDREMLVSCPRRVCAPVPEHRRIHDNHIRLMREWDLLLGSGRVGSVRNLAGACDVCEGSMPDLYGGISMRSMWIPRSGSPRDLMARFADPKQVWIRGRHIDPRRRYTIDPRCVGLLGSPPTGIPLPRPVSTLTPHHPITALTSPHLTSPHRTSPHRTAPHHI